MLVLATAGHLRSLLSWLAPGGLVAAAAFGAVQLADDSSILAALPKGYAYPVYIAGALLAWRFHRSRVVAAIAAVVIAATAVQYGALGTEGVAYMAAATLLPVALGVLAVMKDRGLVSFRGAAAVAAVVVTPFLVSLSLEFQPQITLLVLAGEPLSDRWFGRTPLTQPALLGFAFAFVLAMTVAIRRRGAVEKGLLWTLVACFLALHSASSAAESSLFFAAAGLTLGLSVVETSYRLAYTDDLTGLPTRRALQEALTAVGSSYSIAMVDVDHFKRINDRYGHDVGDQALRMVASKVKRVAGGGRGFRYGGEEFTVVFPGKGKAEVKPHLQKLKRVVAESRFVLRGRGRPRRKSKGSRRAKPGRSKASRGGSRELAVTVSIGVAERDERHSTAREVLKAADRALYQAKRGGRNRVRG